MIIDSFYDMILETFKHLWWVSPEEQYGPTDASLQNSYALRDVSQDTMHHKKIHVLGPPFLHNRKPISLLDPRNSYMENL